MCKNSHLKMRFINREQELSLLEAEYSRDGASFVVIYGRRRTGKTTLIQQFIKNKPLKVYLFANEEAPFQQINRFKNIIAQIYEDKFALSINFNSWHQLFEYLASKMTGSRNKLIFVIDEFQYLAQVDSAFPSILQQHWDSRLKFLNIMVILSGSQMSMMYRTVLNYSSPLYGRRTAQIKLLPFDLRNTQKFFGRELDFEQLLSIYAITGGVPKYLEFIDADQTINDIVYNNFFNKSAFLYNEARFLLEQEFDRSTNFFSLLKIIALGANKLSEISARLQMKATSVSRYLDILRDLQIIDRQVPVTENNPQKSKRGIYRIKDYYLRFWFAFVYPYENYLEIGNSRYLMDNFTRKFQLYLSQIFEEQARLLALDYVPFPVQKIGRYWDKNVEIDIVAFNEDTSQIAFGECKWQNRPVGRNVLIDLIKKASQVQWHSGNRQEYFLVFSKTGFTGAAKAFAAERNIKLISSAELKL